MFCNYIMDISEKSHSILHTPAVASKQLPFYVMNSGHYYAQKEYYTEREGLENFLLIFTIAGSGKIEYRGKSIEVQPNQIFFINCSEHQYYKTVSDLWEFRWLHVNGTACPMYFDMMNGDSLNIVTASDPAKINELMDNIPLLLESRDTLMDWKLSMIITNLLTELIENKHNVMNAAYSAQHTEYVQKAIQFMEQNYASKVNIADICSLIHISEYYFCRLFKKCMGVSPYEYLTNFRITKAKALLSQTKLPVHVIAQDVGFDNVNNFIRSFKIIVGTTPLKFRKLWIS